MKNVGIFILLTIFLAHGDTHAVQPNEKPAANPAAELLRFKYTFANNTNKPLALTSVGVESKPLRPGAGGCKGFVRITEPVADYIVRYNINVAGETIVAADPVLTIPPHEAKSFDVAVVPTAAGFCHASWETSIRVIIVFSDGKKFFSTPQTISGFDVERFQQNTPNDQEIVKALQHKDPNLRRQGIEQLVASNIDRASASILIGHKLHDTSPEVKSAAISAVGTLRLTEHVPALLQMSATLNRTSEMGQALFVALARTGDPLSADVVLRALQGCDPYLNELYCSSIFNEMTQMRTSAVSQKAKAILESYLRKQPIHSTEDVNNPSFPYYAHMHLVFLSRERIDPMLVQNILRSPKFSGIRPHLLQSMVMGYAKNNEVGTIDPTEERIEDPAYLGNRAEFRRLISDPDEDVRRDALFLWLATSSGSKSVEESDVIRRALEDPESHVATTAAQWAGIGNYKEFKGLIRSKFEKSGPLWERRMYCLALVRLGAAKDGTITGRGNWMTCK